MALINLGPMVAQVSGRVAGIVFSHNRGGAYVRNGSIPVKVSSDKALSYKAILSAASQGWSALTDAQRSAWKAFGQTKTTTNRLGKAIKLSGQNWYIALTARLLAAGEAAIVTPPVDAAPTTPVITDFVADTKAGETTLEFTPDPLGTTNSLYIRAAKVNSAAITNVEGLLTTAIITPANTQSPLDLEAALVATFGAMQEGATYVLEIRTLDRATGLVSGRVFARTVCIATP